MCVCDSECECEKVELRGTGKKEEKKERKSEKEFESERESGSPRCVTVMRIASHAESGRVRQKDVSVSWP